jgi:hypothetical protein
VHQGPELGDGTPVHRRVRLVDAQTLGGERHVVVDQSGGGAGEEVVVDAGQQADPPLLAQGGQTDGYVGPQRPLGHRAHECLDPLVRVAVQPEAGVRRRDGAAGRAPPRLPPGAVSLCGLVAGIPGVVQLEPRDRPKMCLREGLKGRRPARAGVDQGGEEVEGHHPAQPDHRGLTAGRSGRARPGASPGARCRAGSAGGRTPLRGHDGVLRFGADGWEEPVLAYLDRHVVVLGLEAEGTGHAATPGIHLDDLDPGDPGEQRDRRSRPHLGLLVAVSVVEHLAAGQPGARIELQPALVDRLGEQLLHLADAAADVPDVGVVRQQRPVLVAQREQACSTRCSPMRPSRCGPARSPWPGCAASPSRTRPPSTCRAERSRLAGGSCGATTSRCSCTTTTGHSAAGVPADAGI